MAQNLRTGCYPQNSGLINEGEVKDEIEKGISAPLDVLYHSIMNFCTLSVERSRDAGKNKTITLPYEPKIETLGT